MSLQFSVNNLPSTGSVAMYTLFNQLVAVAGWTVPSSSDGTTYNSSGNQITGGGTGAHGLGNNNAWFRVRMPGSTREWCIQRGTTDLVWRIKYSLLGFSGGSPSGTQVPSATDEQVLLGGGTNASPSFNTLYGSNGSFRYHIAADNAAPYGFWAIAIPSGGNSNSVFIFDPLTSGTYDASDPDPYVMMVGSALFMIDSTLSGTSGYWGQTTSPAPQSWLNGTFAYTGACAFTFGGGVAPGGNFATTNPVSGFDDLLPVYYGRNTAQTQPCGIKGRGTLTLLTTVARSNLDTYNVNGGSLNKIVFGYLVFDWSGATPLT